MRGSVYRRRFVVGRLITRLVDSSPSTLIHHHRSFYSDVAVLVPDIIKVTQGPEAGKTWLCDRYITGYFKKFSGTNEAGDGRDLFSKAVNALAHYVAEQSEWSMVPTDIQGMSGTCIHRIG